MPRFSLADDDNDAASVDDNSVVSNHGLPWKVRNRAIYRLLLKRGADCTAMDKDGNLPFFLSAATEWLDATFPILRMAAKQGIFESKNQRITVPVHALKEKKEEQSICTEMDAAAQEAETLRKKRRVD